VADIELTSTSLIVHIRGFDQFFALQSRLEVPLEHISAVEASVPEAHGAWHGLRVGGTNLPGVITAGRFVQHGEWAFWDVHDPDKAIAIRLRDERYAKLVIGVDDPAATAKAITAALA
jgi:phage terminase large subunit-like protein